MSAQSEQGVIVRGIGGFYYVQGAREGLAVLRAPGVFRRRGRTPLIGDRVL